MRSRSTSRRPRAAVGEHQDPIGRDPAPPGAVRPDRAAGVQLGAGHARAQLRRRAVAGRLDLQLAEVRAIDEPDGAYAHRQLAGRRPVVDRHRMAVAAREHRACLSEHGVEWAGRSFGGGKHGHNRAAGTAARRA